MRGMSGDYSRFTDRPERRYSGVLMQQGRVQLDADWNEHVDIAQRRWEVQAEDTFGASGVPRATTPDGFKISAAPGNDLAIAAGRIYVDGKLAELFAGEQVGAPAVAVSYLHQPFYPEPPALPAGAKTILLDVWDREVTYVEDPDILEKALGGPDTATRRQIVWQLRAVAASGGAGTPLCGAPFPKPSGGLLSTQAVAPPASDDPCDLAPSGGYRGLENRLYRVEVHTGGALAAARFKWSRDNASVVSTVTGITGSATASQLTVTRIGRDAVLRFAKDDWVEVTDDVRELMGEAGEMAKIAGVDEASRTITLDRQIPAGTGRAFGATGQELAARHTRVRLWNQALGVDGNGLLTQTGGSWISLEDGVQVQLSQAGTADLQVGDYWVFAARAVDGSVEVLQQAEPRGIRHHYSQLAAITASGDVHDCRRLWPETACCCCTAEVGDGKQSHGDFDDLEEAVAQLSSRVPAELPLVICLLPGTHRLQNTVAIQRDRVTIRGCGRASHVVAPPGRPAFDLAADFGALEGIFLTVETDSAAPAILCGGNGNRVEANEVVTGTGPAIWSAIAFNLTVAGNRLSGAIFLVGGDLLGRAASAGAGAAPAERNRLDLPALVVLDGGTRFARVTGNFLGPAACHGIGLTLSTLWDVTIAGNEIRGLGGSGIASINVPPLVLPSTPIGQQFDEAAIADAMARDRKVTQGAGTEVILIIVPTPRRVDLLRIERNTIAECCHGTGSVAGPPLGGIVLGRLMHVQISENRIERNGRSQAAEPVAGIFVDDCKGLIVRDNVVVDNGREPDGQRIAGPQGGILGDKLSVVVESVSLNVKGTGGRTAAIQPDGWPAAAIQDNLVVAPRGPALALTGMGAMQVTGNRLTAREVLGRLQDKTSRVEDFFGAVLIHNLGMPDYVFPQFAALGLLTPTVDPPPPDASGQGDVWTVGGKVDFSHNQVNLDLVSGQVEVAVAALGLITMDDLSLQDNQTECTLLLDVLLVDMLALALTVRANGNGCTESWLGVWLSLWAIGLLMSTGVANQGTHCIRIDGPAGRVRDADNLALFCQDKVRSLTLAQAQETTVNQATT
jgi:uncharacterized protein DUF6519